MLWGSPSCEAVDLRMDSRQPIAMQSEVWTGAVNRIPATFRTCLEAVVAPFGCYHEKR